MATDLAEVVGAAIGLNLLFGIPLLAAGLIAPVIASGVLSFQLRGHRAFERATVFLLACGGSPARILVFSQVILSFGIPFALVPLVLITRNKHIMGAFAIGRWTTSAMWLITATITLLNVVLLWQFAL